MLRNGGQIIMRDANRQRSARYASHTQGPSLPCRGEFCSENAYKNRTALIDGPTNCSGVEGYAARCAFAALRRHRAVATFSSESRTRLTLRVSVCDGHRHIDARRVGRRSRVTPDWVDYASRVRLGVRKSRLAPTLHSSPLCRRVG